MSAIIDLRLDQIVIAEGRRPLENVDGLLESVRDRGLLNPILVTTDYRLIAGAHRIEVYRRLELEYIKAIVIDCDEIERQLAEIDENLCRNELTKMDRALQMKRRKELYEQKYPETKHGASRNPLKGVRKEKSQTLALSSDIDQCNAGPEPVTKAFVDATAKATGRSKASIKEDIRRGEAIAWDVKEAIRTTPIANRGKDLDTLSHLTPDEQRAAVASAVDGKLTVKPKQTRSPRARKPTRDEQIKMINRVYSQVREAKTQWKRAVNVWNEMLCEEMYWAGPAVEEFENLIEPLLRWLDSAKKRVTVSDAA